MKNRTLIGVICIALAVAIMFGVSPFISMLSSEKIDVIQVNKFISEGEQITEADIVTVEIGKHGASVSVITNAEDVVGKYATTNLYPETYLIPAMVTSDANNAESVLKTLDKDHLAISITVPSFAAALSAKLENGDIVSVVVSTVDETFIPEELKYVRVITTTTSEGVDNDDLGSLEEGAETLPATITLHVTPLQAKLLAEYELKADMHLALVSRGNAEAATELLNEQAYDLEQILLEQQDEEELAAGELETENGGEENE